MDRFCWGSYSENNIIISIKKFIEKKITDKSTLFICLSVLFSISLVVVFGSNLYLSKIKSLFNNTQN